MTASGAVAGCATAGTSTRREPRHYDHLAPLLAEFASLDRADPRRRTLRDELATAFMPVVRNIAGRYRGRGEPVDDLEQVGAIGLLNALERFDPERFHPEEGFDFLSYAVPTITGEVRRHFRDRTWSMRMPRRLKELQGPVRRAVATLSSTLERAPRPREIAALLDIPLDDVIEALKAQTAYAADSLDALAGNRDVALGDLLGQVDAELETAEYREALHLALAELPERERTIVLLRFFGNLSQTQIAEQVGISQMHVSRQLSRTLAVLRQRLEGD
jgi:RNA polymerase sigma-B factor